MTRPALDFATHGPDRWAYAVGCWRKWCDRQADWIPSSPPPADARFTTYLAHIQQEAA